MKDTQMDMKKKDIITLDFGYKLMDNLMVKFGYNYIVWHNPDFELYPDFELDEFNSMEDANTLIKHDYFMSVDYSFK